MSNYPVTDFTGDCGEGTQKGHPLSVTSSRGLQPNETASIRENTDLSYCMLANDGGRVFGITLNPSPGIYDYVVHVDAQGPKGIGSGSMYLAFTDETDDTYFLSIYSSSRSVHTVRYNSKRPAIKKIWWSNYSFGVKDGMAFETEDAPDQDAASQNDGTASPTEASPDQATPSE